MVVGTLGRRLITLTPCQHGLTDHLQVIGLNLNPVVSFELIKGTINLAFESSYLRLPNDALGLRGAHKAMNTYFFH